MGHKVHAESRRVVVQRVLDKSLDIAGIRPCKHHHATLQQPSGRFTALSWVNESACNLRMGYEITKRIWTTPAHTIIQARWEFQTCSSAPATRGFELERLMIWSPALNCTDARDRMYATLSLLSADESARLATRPDYSKSAADLFTELVEKHVDDKNIRKGFYFPQQLRLMLCLADDDPAVETVKKRSGDEWHATGRRIH